MSAQKQDARCKAIAKSGKPCRAASTKTGLCFFHSHPNKAAELGSIGGKRNRRPRVGGAIPLPPPDGASVDQLDWIYNAVRTGELAPNAGTTMLKVLAEKERRNDRVIESQMAEMQDDLRTLKSLIQIRDIEALTSAEALTSQEALTSEDTVTSEKEEPEF